MDILKAKAKINLFFQITGKRPDGYHLMESLVVFADDIYDEIEISPAEFNSTSIIGGEFAGDLSSDDNLINKALNAFTRDGKYHCKLSKNIPIGAGLGGGSSDAATIAKFLQYSDADLNEKLLRIGADLPICYHQTAAFCSGIGEIIEPIKNFPKLHLLLVNPRKTLLTKDVFKNNTKISTPLIKNKPLDFSNDSNKLIDFICNLNNDLSISAIELMSEIQDILGLIAAQDACLISRMSGSGPTCFGIFADKEAAIKAECKMLLLQPNYWIKHTTI